MERKKILIITYYWPPAGGPGVQRWLKFVKYLPEFEIEPLVYCPENPHYPILDETLHTEVSSGLKIFKQPIKEPYQFAQLFSKTDTKKISSGIIPKAKKQSLIQKLLLFIRGNFFIPDARKNWVKPSIEFLTPLIEKEGIDTIITTGPPHSLHLIGLELKSLFPLKWIADFRDPWTTIGYHEQLKLTAKSQKRHKELEQKVLQAAHAIIVTSFNTKKEFELKTKQPIHVITNGYDKVLNVKTEKDKNFSIAHIGSLLSDRNPKLLWEVLSELCSEIADFKDHLEIKLIGVVSEEIVKSLSEHQLIAYLKNYGYVSHKEALEHQKKSQILLLIEINSTATKAIIPGKLFEYMISETPIVAIGPEDSDVETIIRHTNTGAYFNYSDKARLKQHITTCFEDFLNGSLRVNAIGLEPYSRRSLTKQLAEVVEMV